ncbi:MAG: hypothetical protein ACMG6E_05370 [Candidatus Roizmanbacteria bacterium]
MENAGLRRIGYEDECKMLRRLGILGTKPLRIDVKRYFDEEGSPGILRLVRDKMAPLRSTLDYDSFTSVLLKTSYDILIDTASLQSTREYRRNIITRKVLPLENATDFRRFTLSAEGNGKFYAVNFWTGSEDPIELAQALRSLITQRDVLLANDELASNHTIRLFFTIAQLSVIDKNQDSRKALFDAQATSMVACPVRIIGDVKFREEMKEWGQELWSCQSVLDK